MTHPGSPELTVVMDSVITMREQQLWPYPDPVEVALAAERAGVDGILVTLLVNHVSVRDRDWRMFDVLRRARLCLAAPLRTDVLQSVADSAAGRCVLIPESRHEHTRGGSLALSVAAKEIAAACRLFETTGIELAARVDPEPQAVERCAEAGLRAVEFNTSAFALAARPDSRARRIGALRAAIAAARRNDLQVSIRGGLSYANVGELLSGTSIPEVRIGQAIIAQALFDGIAASVARMRHLLEGEGQ